MLDATDLAIYRAAQSGAMHDTCKIMAYSSTRGATGEEIGVWTAGAALACGIEETNGTKRYRTEATELPIDAVVRLPLTVTVDAKDKIQMTHHYGEALAVPVEYVVIGEPKRGPSAQLIDVRRVSL